MRKSILSILIFLSTAVAAQTYSGPESVEYDYANNRWLIANTTSHQVIARNSAGALSVFVSGLVSGPYGIEIVGDTLFCCSGSSIKGYLLSNGSPVFNLNVGATFLNGITHDDLGNLIATDFSAKKIYKVNIGNATATVIASNLTQSPNGIIFDAPNNRCVFVNWGNAAPIKAIDLSNNAVTILTNTNLSNCDGIALDNQGNFYVSAWGTQTINKFNGSFTGSPITVATGLNNPADIFYNTLSDTLGIPNSGNNTVDFIGFSTTAIEGNFTEDEILVASNAATSTLFISVKLKKASSIVTSLIGSDGRLIQQSTTLKSVSGLVQNFEISTARISAGVYFLRFSIDGRTSVKKIILW